MPTLKAPTDLTKALATTPKAKLQWASLSPVAQYDFITWIEGAKQTITRQKRISKACDVLAKGQRRPCCYAVVPLAFYSALNANPKAKATWSTLPPLARRALVSTIDSAKTKEAKQLKIEKACEKLAKGN